MAGSLDGGRIAFVCTHGGERVESTTPVEAFRAAGASAEAGRGSGA